MLDLVEHSNHEILWLMGIAFVIGMLVGNVITEMVLNHYKRKDAEARWLNGEWL
jgi:hypothetical protein